MPESSPEFEAEVSTAEVSTEPDVSTAESSTADTGVKTSLVDAIRASIEPVKESTPDSATGQDATAAAKPEVGEQPAEDQQPVADPTEEELKRYKPETASRMRQLMAQRLEQFERAEDLRPKAESFEKIATYLEKANISTERADAAFHILDLEQRDPAAALKALDQYRDTIAQRAGEVLPDDLKEDVRFGYISEQRARELSRARAGEQQSRERLRESEEQQQKREAAAKDAELTQQATKSLNDWEKLQSRSDPDWHLKRERLDELMELRFRRTGHKPTSQEAVKWASEALEAVNKSFTRFRPTPKEIKPVTNQSSSGNRHPEPKTFRDAIAQAVQRTHQR